MIGQAAARDSLALPSWTVENVKFGAIQHAAGGTVHFIGVSSMVSPRGGLAMGKPRRPASIETADIGAIVSPPDVRV
jgi:hypothetical protein